MDPFTLNIGGDQNDEFFRYKMERLRVKEEGRGNGIKTSFPNMPEVAKALRRPPTYLTKFIGNELGAQSRSDEKQRYYMVTGTHTEKAIGEIVDKFVKTFVLCEGCQNPETDMKVKPKAGSISLLCTACGHKTRVNTRNKLCTFIFKNPPSDAYKHAVGSGAVNVDSGSSKKGGKKGKGKDKEADGEGAADGGDDADADGGGGGGGGDDAAGKKPKKKKTKEEQVAEVDEELFAAAAQIDINDEEEVEWKTDISAEAAEKRRLELLGDMSERAMENLAGVPDASKKAADEEARAAKEAEEEAARAKAAKEAEEAAARKKAEEEEAAAKKKAEEEAAAAAAAAAAKGEDGPTCEVAAEDMLEYLSSYINDHIAEPKRAAREFSRVCDMHGLTGSKRVRLIVGAVFDEKFLSKAKQLAPVVHAAVGQGDTKQQRTIVNTIERLVASQHQGMVEKFPVILKALYEFDLAEEDAINKWYDEPKAKDVPKKDQKEIRAAAKVFVDWLREAETESEDEDEE